MAKLTGIFKQIEERTFSIDNCFLCGCKLTKSNKTVEHVIPKWLQTQFNLWNQKITLLNGTLLSYRQLTIPCCFDCNNKYLKPFEDKIKIAFDNGFESFKLLDNEIIFYWIGKIYFGLMYRELFLSEDRTNPNASTITDPDYIKSFYTHFLFLQGIRNIHSFKGFFPASIHLFKTQKNQLIDKQWDIIDSHIKPFIAIRMGEIGIIAPLQDCGSSKFDDSQLDIYRENDLHSLQFRELTAMILYKYQIFNRIPKFINIQNSNSIETNLIPIQGISNKALYDNWDNNVYAKLLSDFVGIPIEKCQPEIGKVRTWLVDNENKSLFLNEND